MSLHSNADEEQPNYANDAQDTHQLDPPSQLEEEEEELGPPPPKAEFEGKKVANLERYFKECTTAHDIIQVYWDFPKQFHDIPLPPSSAASDNEVNVSQKMKDLTRETFVIQGELFDSHVHNENATATSSAVSQTLNKEEENRIDDESAAPVLNATTLDETDPFLAQFTRGNGTNADGGDTGSNNNIDDDNDAENTGPDNLLEEKTDVAPNLTQEQPFIPLSAAIPSGSAITALADGEGGLEASFRKVVAKLNSTAKHQFSTAPQFGQKYVSVLLLCDSSNSSVLHIERLLIIFLVFISFISLTVRLVPRIIQAMTRTLHGGDSYFLLNQVTAFVVFPLERNRCCRIPGELLN